MKEVKTYLNPKDVLIVLPVAEIVDDERCVVNKNTEFKIKKFVPSGFDGNGLLHVRVANGNSVNVLVHGAAL